MPKFTWTFATLAAMLLVHALPSGVRAQDNSSRYPSRPITLIVPFAAGGSSDVLARAVAQGLGQRLGTSVVVESRPGVGGQIGAEAVAHAAADGYTLLFGTIGSLGIGPALYKNLRYDPLKDLTPVSMLHQLPLVLIVSPTVPAKTLPELIELAHSKPGQLTFASAGVGSVSHLAMELFKDAAKIDVLHVPYKGGGAVGADLISGRVAMMLETIPNAMTLAGNGARALAVTTAQRSAAAPQLPTLAESGLTGFSVVAWTGLFAPGATPPPVIARLNAAVRAEAQDLAYGAQMRAVGTDVVTSSPEEMGAFMREDIARWKAVISRTGIKQID